MRANLLSLLVFIWAVVQLSVVDVAALGNTNLELETTQTSNKDADATLDGNQVNDDMYADAVDTIPTDGIDSGHQDQSCDTSSEENAADSCKMWTMEPVEADADGMVDVWPIRDERDICSRNASSCIIYPPSPRPINLSAGVPHRPPPPQPHPPPPASPPSTWCKRRARRTWGPASARRSRACCITTRAPPSSSTHPPTPPAPPTWARCGPSPRPTVRADSESRCRARPSSTTPHVPPP